MSTGKMDSSAVYALFEELRQKIDELGEGTVSNSQNKFDTEEIAVLLHELRTQANKKPLSSDQLKQLQKIFVQVSTYSLRKTNESHAKLLTNLKAIIVPINEKISQLQTSQNRIIRKEHVFIMDFRNSKTAVSIIIMGLIILLLLSGNIWQFRKNNQLKDNDLKYRYIKMQGKADSENLIWLETIFTYNRNKDSISEIRKQVKSHERLVKEQAEKIEEKRLSIGNKKQQK